MAYFSLVATSINQNTGSIANPESGAYVEFRGLVRRQNEGKIVVRLEYEAYPELAQKVGDRIVHDATARFGLQSAHAVHRTGDLAIGDVAVIVEVLAVHRGEAFDACRWILDQIKSEVPIWKHEHYENGESEWILCTHHH